MPSANSPTPARSVRPLTVHTMVPGASGVPTDRKASGPSMTMAGTLASVSTLFTSVAAAGSMPSRYGGATRGNGGLPSIASSSAVSSPRR